MEPEITAFVNISQFKDLATYVCEYDPNEERDKSAKSDYNFQILKSRSLITDNNKLQILCAPHTKNQKYILIIFSKITIEEKQFNEVITKFRLTIVDKPEVTSELLETCFNFTFKVRLSPLWNHIDKRSNIFVNDRDFLIKKTPLNAVKLNIYCYDGTVKFVINVYKLTLNHLEITDLDEPPEILDIFHKKPDAKIFTSKSKTKSFTVLPSFAKGRIISLNKIIPEDSPFNNYKDLRRYWKNIHGYRLPDNDDDLIFYEVFFSKLIGRLAYPSLCLLKNTPISYDKSTRNEKDEILKIFIKNIYSRMDTILGTKIKFDSEYSFIDWNNSHLTSTSFDKNDVDDDDIFKTQLSLCTPAEKFEKQFASSHGVINSDDYKSQSSGQTNTGAKILDLKSITSVSNEKMVSKKRKHSGSDGSDT